MTLAEYRAYLLSQKVSPKASGSKPKSKGLSFAHSCLHVELRRYLESKYGEVLTEYTFHPERRWKFDYYIPSIASAVEIEGIGSGWKGKSRHLTPDGFQEDIAKYSEAQSMGITIWRWTYNDLKKLKYQLYL